MYTLRFPFSLPPSWEIAVTDVSGELDGLMFSLKKQDKFYVITINGFPAEDAAEQYKNNVWAGLMWILLHCGLPPELIFESGKVVYTEDPEQAARNLGFGDRLDGIVDGDRPAVYPTEKRVRTLTGGQVNFRITKPAQYVIDFFRAGVSFPESASVIDDAKLRVALELYGAHFTEISGNAKFLSLVMALESLATGSPRTQVALDLLDKWKKEVEELKKNISPESDDAASLEALSRELLIRKEDSIRRQIRTLVLTTLQANGDDDAITMARTAVQVYDRRSTLVHDGKLESHVLSQATSEAKNIVERVLRIRFAQKANPAGK
jgi:hypothetical protein